MYDNFYIYVKKKKRTGHWRQVDPLHLTTQRDNLRKSILRHRSSHVVERKSIRASHTRPCFKTLASLNECFGSVP